jgi:hypothetical protein
MSLFVVMLHAVGELRGEFLPRVVVLAVQVLALPAHALQQCLSTHLHTVQQRGGELFGDEAAGVAEDLDVALRPGAFDLLEGRIFEPSISGASDSMSLSSCTQQRAKASSGSTVRTISNGSKCARQESISAASNSELPGVPV